MRTFFFVERPTLRVGHPALGCNNHKANATLTTVNLYNNKIGDRGAVALAGAVQALLATVFSCRPDSLLLRFGLDNLLPVTLSRPFDVLENRAFGTRKSARFAPYRLSGRETCFQPNEAAHVMSADQRYSCVNDGSPSP